MDRWLYFSLTNLLLFFCLNCKKKKDIKGGNSLKIIYHSLFFMCVNFWNRVQQKTNNAAHRLHCERGCWLNCTVGVSSLIWQGQGSGLEMMGIKMQLKGNPGRKACQIRENTWDRIWINLLMCLKSNNFNLLKVIWVWAIIGYREKLENISLCMCQAGSDILWKSCSC